MSWYSLKREFIFIHIPKNAGSAIVAHLKGVLGDDFSGMEALAAEHGVERDMVFGNHFTYNMIQAFVDEYGVALDYRKSYKFCVVRNPWVRMVSLYNHRLRKLHATFRGKPRNSPEDIELLQRGFNAWLRETQHTSDRVLTKLPQTTWIKDGDGKFVCDCVIPHEMFNQGIQDVFRFLCLPDIPVGRVNFSEHDSSLCDNYYDEESKRHVAKFFEEDIDTFGYTYPAG